MMRPSLKQLSAVTAILACSLYFSVAEAADCEIDGSMQEQWIRGFGACSAWISQQTLQAKADMLFDTINGIGLSMFRIRIPPNKNEFSSTFGPPKIALEYGVKDFWAAPWSPPASMKDNNNVNNGGNLKTASYQEYAAYLTDYVTQANEALGIDLLALSVQNEPDNTASYESCRMDGATIRNFIKDALGPAMEAANPSTKIIMAECMGGDAGRNKSYMDPTLNDADAAKYVMAAACHIYAGGPVAYPLAKEKGKEYWETEISRMNSTYDASMSMGMQTARWIHDCIAGCGMNAFHYWWLVNNQANEGLLGSSNATPKRYYTFGNFSKFIRPGFHRIGATIKPTSGLSASAYSDSLGKRLVIVVLNTGSSTVTQKFVLKNITVDNVTPYITSSSLNLEAQDAVTVADGSFSYDLPGTSVTSFVTRDAVTVLNPSLQKTAFKAADYATITGYRPQSIIITAARGGSASIALFDLSGKQVVSLSGITLTTGRNVIATGSRSPAPGIYSWQIVAGTGTCSRGSIAIHRK